MSLNIPGLLVMVLFYLLVLATGIWASMKSKQAPKSSQTDLTETTLLGNRGISLVVGVFTMTGECGPRRWKLKILSHFCTFEFHCDASLSLFIDIAEFMMSHKVKETTLQ